VLLLAGAVRDHGRAKGFSSQAVHSPTTGQERLLYWAAKPNCTLAEISRRGTGFHVEFCVMVSAFRPNAQGIVA